MKNKIITVVVLLILLLVSIFGYELIFKTPLVESPVKEETSELPMSTLDIKEQYQDGVYTFAGTIQVPTPCHLVESNVTTAGDNQYEININTVAPGEDVMCAQVITDKNYKVSFEAPEDAVIRAFVDGVEYELNRFEVPAGQDIDSFELFIKA